MPEAFVLRTLRTARTKASPRGGFAGTSPVDLLVSLQRELVRRTDPDPGRVEDVTGGGLLRRASAVESGTVELPSGSWLRAACLADLLAESGRGEPREFGVSVDAFTDLCRSGRIG